MSWWLSDVARAKAEQASLARLLERVDWLSTPTWRFGDQLELIADFEIRHGEESFRLSMTYPSAFPDTPPMVRPREDLRLSSHQYGAGGELCLEYRPDNWEPSITGAMMVESAHRLLAGERPAGGSEGVVRSAHQCSAGRDARGSHMRFVLDPAAVDVLAALSPETAVPITAWDRFDSPAFTAGLLTIGNAGELWSTRGPKPSRSAGADGFAFRTEQDVERFRSNPQQFTERLAADFPEIASRLPEQPYSGFLLLGNTDRWVVLNLTAFQGGQSVFSYSAILAPRSDGRLPGRHLGLADRRVAIVGCGSIGSKVATSLARSGVRKLTLVDDDIFFEANLVRNDLDGQAIGRHKVDALAARLTDLAVDMDVAVRRIALGGQESAGVTESVLDELGRADLLVDATAEPRAFNLIAAVARRRKIPMVWCEVYGGGIGGLVARTRPGIDPTPTFARAQIQAWAEAQGVSAGEAPRATVRPADYAVERGDQPPLVADDADVSVIAGHATRFCLDVLTNEPSAIPASAYAFGLMKAWIFAAPFDTWPIELRPQGEWGEAQEAATAEELKEFLASLSSKAAE